MDKTEEPTETMQQNTIEVPELAFTQGLFQKLFGTNYKALEFKVSLAIESPNALCPWLLLERWYNEYPHDLEKLLELHFRPASLLFANLRDSEGKPS
jgi:hypothetical protein